MNRKIIEEIVQFGDERNWKQYHNPKDLAISLTLEASELLEIFQWSSSEEAVSKNLESISDELADILVYCVLLADSLDLDIDRIIRNKLQKNNIKYPIAKAYGKKDKYDEL